MRARPIALFLMLALLGGCAACAAPERYSGVPARHLAWDGLGAPPAATGTQRYARFDHAARGPASRVEATAQKPDANGATSEESGPTKIEPGTPDWFAKEQAIEEKLKKRMMICRGC